MHNFKLQKFTLIFDLDLIYLPGLFNEGLILVMHAGA